MRFNLTAAVVAVGLCLLFAGLACSDVRAPFPEQPTSTRYTAKRGSTNLPDPQPTSIQGCHEKVKAAIRAEGATRSAGSITYQCITTETYGVGFVPSTVTPPVRSAVLSWTGPTHNTDGSTSNNLAGYRISYGSSPTELVQTIQIANAGLSSYTISNLAPGTYYFAVRAYTSSGTESNNSNVESKVVL